jgi:TolB protein
MIKLTMFKGFLIILLLINLLVSVKILFAKDDKPAVKDVIAFVRITDKSRIYLINADGTNERKLTDGDDTNFSWSPDGTKIAFESNRNGNCEIYVVSTGESAHNKNPGGRIAQNLTNNPFDDKYPVWSPDGTHVAFHSNRENTWEIYLVNIENLKCTKLTMAPQGYYDWNAAWSPDGAKILFIRGREKDKNTWDIYSISRDGRNEQRLTANNYYDGEFAWSPDAKKIAFVSNRDGNDEIYVINSDGSNLTRLTNDNIMNDYPVWSPDGTKIAFQNKRTDKSVSICVMNADSSNKKELTDPKIRNELPAWTVDGNLIVFTSMRNGNREIYAMKIDGTCQQRLTNAIGDDTNPVSPHEPLECNCVKVKAITFISNRDGDWGLYLMDEDGKNLRRLTDKKLTNRPPVWSPDGRKIAFISYAKGTDDYLEHEEIYVICANGNHCRQLTNNAGCTSDIKWSPDSKKIAYLTLQFYAEKAVGHSISVIDVKTKDQKDIVTCPYGFGICHLAWSPDNNEIMFVQGAGIKKELYKQEASEAIVIENNSKVICPHISGPAKQGKTKKVINPAVSYEITHLPPDGLIKPAFMYEELDVNIYTTKPDGSDTKKITNHKWASYPAWSPDGKKIAFISPSATKTKDKYILHTPELYVLEKNQNCITETKITSFTPLSNSNLTNINYEFDLTYPTWSPDGAKIAFISSPSTRTDVCIFYKPELYLIEMGNSKITETKLTNFNVVTNLNTSDCGFALMGLAWHPDSTKILFTSSVMIAGPIYAPSALHGATIADYITNGWAMYSITTAGTTSFNLSAVQPYSKISDTWLAPFANRAITTTDFDIYPNWSPDGTKIVFNHGGAVTIKENGMPEEKRKCQVCGKVEIAPAYIYLTDNGFDRKWDIFTMELSKLESVNNIEEVIKTRLNLTNNQLKWSDIFPVWSPAK